MEKYPVGQLAGGLLYVTSRSERGRWKSTRKGNSLAAYSTASTVLEASGGGDPFAEPNRNAAKRLLTQLRSDYPQLKCLVVEDSLAANGPHLNLLRSLNLRYLINVKEGDHEALFDAVQEKLGTDECQEWEYTDAQGVEHGYRWVNDLPLNKTHSHIRVNFLEYWEIDGDQQRLFSWITDIELTPDNVEPLMRGGRARWKVENETFNTLKNQGYELEHNYGHGCQHLATVFALLMMLAFLVDQAQELGCPFLTS